MRFKRVRSASLTLLAVLVIGTAFNYSRIRGLVLSTPSDTEQLLQSRLTKVQFDNVPLRKALDSFSKSTGLTFEVNWELLENAYPIPVYSPTVPARMYVTGEHARVTLRLENVTVATALDELLRAGLRHDSDAPAFDVLPNGHVLIGEAEMDRCLVTRLYDLRDLVEDEMRSRDDLKPGESVADAMVRVEAEEAQSLAAGTSPNTAATTASPPPSPLGPVACYFGAAPTSMGNYIADGIVDTVDEFAWALAYEAGLDEKYVRPHGRFLVVTGRPWAHRRIAELLDEVRRADRPVRRIEPEPGQFVPRKERPFGSGGLFGG